MKVSTNIFLSYTLSGIFVFCSGVLNLFFTAKPFKISAMALIVLALLVMLPTFVLKTEPKDEMAQLHLYKAHTTGLFSVILSFAVAAGLICAGYIFEENTVIRGLCERLTLSSALPFFVAVAAIAAGVKFRLLERNGD